MALLGVALSGLLAAVGGAVLLARLLRDTAHPLLGAVAGAVFAVADVASGRTTFALGAVAALGALNLLHRPRWAVLLGVVTALLSPVAAAFLGFAAAVLVLHRRPGGWSVGLAASVPVVVLAVLFPGGGVQPFQKHSAVPAVLIALTLAVLTSEPVVRTGALLYAGAVAVLAFHHDPFGSNVLRLGLLVAAALLLATSRRHPLVVLVAAVWFLSWQVGPPQGDLQAERGPDLRAVTAELQRLGSRRAEVVAPRDHREAHVVAERVPLARGWSRQVDRHDNPLFYSGTLTAPAYLAWLRANAVDHVAVPRDAVIDFGSTREAALLADGPVAGLEQVWQDAAWTVYRVVDPTPIAQPPVTVVSSGRSTLVLRADGPVSTRVDVRWSRWLSVTGPACVERDGDRTRVRFTAAGTATLGSGLTPHGHC
jgi:hypothetical protein